MAPVNSSLTVELAGFLSSLRIEDIPERARAAARIGMTDCLGTIVAGAREPAPRMVATLVSETGRNDFAVEIPGGRHLDAADAALVNGTAAHVLDFDDVALAGHPSAVLTPVILALGQSIGSSGQTAVRAYCAGYEVWAQMQLLEPGQLHDRGFHPTAILGAIASAAAAAVMLDLDCVQSANALAISASMAAGLAANFGSMTKSFQVGRSSQAGIQAAVLAKQGFTASTDALEHPRGFLNAFSPSGKTRTTLEKPLGQQWRLEEMGVNIKRHPTCYATHRAIDAMLDLVAAHDLVARSVAEIHVRIGATQQRMLRNSRPQTGLEAKFSMEFAMTAALLAGRVGLAELSDQFVRRQDVQACFGTVRVTTTDEKMPGDETFSPRDTVRVVLADGSSLDHPGITHAKGSWQNPLSRQEQYAKFFDCVASRLGEDASQRLFGQLEEIESLADLRSLAIGAQTPWPNRQRTHA
ncbi:MmgE/PrpD family protein [Hoeflea sp.]|uniref:MmgE/PrpD family protein n=1 Tax=Hoeflea sp. TaxID=1940281 RepID=UPI003A8F45FA